MAEPKFVIAYSVATGEEQRVPAHFLTSPALSKRFRKTPKPVSPKPAPAPVEAPTKKEK